MNGDESFGAAQRMRSGDSVLTPAEVDVDVNITKHKTRNLDPSQGANAKALNGAMSVS